MFLLSYLSLLLIFIEPTDQLEYPCNSTAACGCSRNPASASGNVGGEIVSLNSWGWVVSLAINDTWACSGSLLSASTIVTAAHCVFDILPWQVTAHIGSNYLFEGIQRRVGSNIIIHPKYNNSNVENDIALIQVSPVFDMAHPSLSKICLPSFTNDDYPLINSSVCNITLRVNIICNS